MRAFNAIPLFAYDANYLIDNNLGIIDDAEGARANRSDETAVHRDDDSACRPDAMV
jgi:hypothetical protein